MKRRSENNGRSENKKKGKSKKEEENNNLNKIDEENKNNLMEKAKCKDNNKPFEFEFSADFKGFIEEVKENKFESKPKYIEKPYDQNDTKMNKIASITKFTIISPIEIYYKLKYDEFHKLSLEEDKCSICLCNFYDEELISKSMEEIIKLNEEKKNNYDMVRLSNCNDHFFHVECINNLIGISNQTYIKCPNCNMIYGVMTGNQPKGTMTVYVDKNMKCSGTKANSTIVIEYYFPNGRTYSGTHRMAYLPNNKEGREILALFKVAFDRKLVFTVGTSVTTGMENTTVWNGIHHKTRLNGGSQNFGYPDDTYFNRVKQELAAKGLSTESLGGEKTLEHIVKEILGEEEPVPNNKIDSSGKNKNDKKKKIK